MAPFRQVLMWSVPSIAVFLGIFWFRRKRELAKSYPGGSERMKSLKEELAEVLNAELEARKITPLGKAERAIIKSAPIDIVPNGSVSQRSFFELTDAEVDIEIEKNIKKKSLEKDKKMSGIENSLLTLQINSSHGVKELTVNFIGSIDKQPLTRNEVHVEFSSPNSKIVVKSRAYNEDVSRQGNTKFVNIIENTNDGSSSDDTEKLNNDEKFVDVPSVNTVNGNSYFPNTQTRRISERDSINHSPVDPMLSSPSMSHFSDSHSEGSSDSGQGCSEAASSPPANLNIDRAENALRIHQFIIPQTLVGLLMETHSCFVTQIKAKTGASVYVRRHPDSVKQKIFAVEGTQNEIEAALEMIKEIFPEKSFPDFSVQEISAELYKKFAPPIPKFMQLVESVNNVTIMTCLVSAGHFFLQQPLHHTFPTLHALHRLMAATYQNPDLPSLLRPVKEGSICAAPTENNWYRAQVVSTSEENDTSVVKLVDFGGYLTVDNDQLKEIRSDFMTLPFQATEALLAFVKPANNEPEWSVEALRIMVGLTAGQLLLAQVAGYDEAGLPLVHLYLMLHPQQVIFLNRELVERGLAEWDVPADS